LRFDRVAGVATTLLGTISRGGSPRASSGDRTAMKPLLLLLAAVACNAAPRPINRDTGGTAPLDPPCPTTKQFRPPDGTLRCRELPFTIDLPAGSEVVRQDWIGGTFFQVTLERGVLGVLVGFDDTLAEVRLRLDGLIKEIAADATITVVPAPPRVGATASLGLSFTTPDGGLGVTHGYLVGGWYVVAVAAGRLSGTAARPDNAIGRAFLHSLRFRAPPTAWERRQVFEGFSLELPVAAWELPGSVGDEGAAKVYRLAAEGAAIHTFDLMPSPGCQMLDNIGDSDVPAVVKGLFDKPPERVTGRIVNLGTRALFAATDRADGPIVLNLVCIDPHMALIYAHGDKSVAELELILGRVTAPLRRP
jgi:hypothetical protein